MPDDAQNARGTSQGDDGGDDTSDTNQNASGDAGTSNDTSSSDTPGDNVVTRAELDNALARMKAADKRASDLDAKLKEIQKKDLSELERAKAEAEEAAAANARLADQVKQMALENAFLTDNTYAWHDPSDALRLLDMDGVEVKDGKVEGLKPAIAKLAKAKPHLIKQQDEGKSGNDSSAASGSANNGQRKGTKSTPPRNYSARFPALRKTSQSTT